MPESAKTKAYSPPKTDVEFGPWHAWNSFLMALTKMPAAWYFLSIMFLAPDTKFYCSDSDSNLTKSGNNVTFNDSEWNNVCPTDEESGESVNCNIWEYDRSIFKETLISEWNLVCSRGYWATWTQASFMTGILVGNLVFGFLADRVGRKSSLMAAFSMQASASTLSAFSPTFPLFLISRWFLAVALGGIMVPSSMLCMEVLTGKWKAIVAILFQIPFGIGQTFLSVTAYFFRDWRQLQTVLSIYSACFLCYFWLISESPKWLLSNGCSDEAEKILMKIQKRNVEIVSGNEMHPLKEVTVTSEAANGPTWSDILRKPKLVFNFISIWFMWYASGICFFSMNIYQSKLGGNLFLNVTLGGLIGGVPGPVIGALSTHWFGPKKTLFFSLVISGALVFIPAFPLEDEDKQNWERVVIGIITLAGMSVSWPVLYLYTDELLPQSIRKSGLSICNFFLRLGAFSAPLAGTTASWNLWLLPSIISGLPLIAAFLTITLPENSRLHIEPTTSYKEINLRNCEIPKEDGLSINCATSEKLDSDNLDHIL